MGISLNFSSEFPNYKKKKRKYRHRSENKMSRSTCTCMFLPDRSILMPKDSPSLAIICLTSSTISTHTYMSLNLYFQFHSLKRIEICFFLEIIIFIRRDNLDLLCTMH